MKHPLVNPSLTPRGFGVGSTYKRTSWKSDDAGRCNGDWCAATFWQEANRERSDFRPAEHVIHVIMPGMRTLGRTEQGDFMFDGKPYRVYDLAVLTSIAVWFGTNNGQAMLNNPVWGKTFTKTNEFRVRWQEREKPDTAGHMLRHILHDCALQKCTTGRHFYRRATEREELILDAFLFWLGQTTGRVYLAGLEDYIKRTSKAVWDGYRQRQNPERWKQLQLSRSSQSA
ncbi:hypothetical protein KC887_03380 [Candidatus Kaiserbacteria bacterium]|nr:hypothetical protein [Candidatus Kaiserbacteria bacterium]